MDVVFKVDSSHSIGTGHLMRCLSLAEKIKQHGHKIHFICRNHPGSQHHLAEERGHGLSLLSQNPDANVVKEDHSTWLGAPWEEDKEQTHSILKDLDNPLMIIDHYGLPTSWFQSFYGNYKLVCVDDLMERELPCHAIINQNLTADKNRYKNLVPENCELLLGLECLIIRNQLIEAGKVAPKKQLASKKLLINFGGNDITSETLRFVELLDKNEHHFEKVRVILPKTHSTFNNVSEICERNIKLHLIDWTPTIEEHYQWADICLGASGTSLYERLYFKLPSIIVSVAENQFEIAKKAHEQKLAYYLGHHSQLNKQSMTRFFADSFFKEDEWSAVHSQTQNAQLDFIDSWIDRYFSKEEA